MSQIGHDIAYYLGLTSPSSWPYLAWSGVVGGATILGVVSVIGRRLKCSVHNCYRPRLFQVSGTEHTVCRHHHPGKDTPVTFQVVRDEYEAARPASKDG